MFGELAKYQVLPLDASASTRFVAPRPSQAAGRSVFANNKNLQDEYGVSAMNIIQTAVSQPDEIKPDRQREFEILLSDRSREIIRLFEELERKRHQQAEMNETKSRFVRSKRSF